MLICEPPDKSRNEKIENMLRIMSETGGFFNMLDFMGLKQAIGIIAEKQLAEIEW